MPATCTNRYHYQCHPHIAIGPSPKVDSEYKCKKAITDHKVPKKEKKQVSLIYAKISLPSARNAQCQEMIDDWGLCCTACLLWIPCVTGD
jgi:hypothetical protein